MKPSVDGSSFTPVRHLDPFAYLDAVAKSCWHNQAHLITQAAEHFGIRPSLAASLMLPVLFQAIAEAHADRATMKQLVNEAIDKGFDDWLRLAQVGGEQ